MKSCVVGVNAEAHCIFLSAQHQRFSIRILQMTEICQGGTVSDIKPTLALHQKRIGSTLGKNEV